MKSINKKRFNAYVGFTRDPRVTYYSEEVRWYENESQVLFGTILLDYTDSDYTSLILGRDEIGRVRCIDLKTSFGNISDAENWMLQEVERLEELGDSVFPQGDRRKKSDLFETIVKASRIHPSFDLINKSPTHRAAKLLITEIMPHFFDVDGNFVDQFQTSGFDSRLWELFLFCYFNEEELYINREYYAPDFLLSDGEFGVGVEAVIVGRKDSQPTVEFKSLSDLANHLKNSNEKLDNEMPLKFGSPLFTKLTHVSKKEGLHYWEYPHTKDKPFIIAIADFHEDFSMTWSHPALVTYLYGHSYSYDYDENGKLIVIPKRVENHIDGDKNIISGFFFQENAENVSAILTTTSGTISKFNRIGKQCGLDDSDTLMMRMGTCYDHNPNASKPIPFSYQVTEDCNEMWGEGVSIYHNPVAKHPLPLDFFPNAAQYIFRDGFVISQMPDFFPYSSITALFSSSK